MKDWAQRQAQKTGKTPEQVLRDLNNTTGKWEEAVVVSGCGCRQTLYRMFKRYGIEWTSYRDFEMDGFIGTQKEHCKRIGVSYNTVYYFKKTFGLSAADAIELTLSKKRRREAA